MSNISWNNLTTILNEIVASNSSEEQSKNFMKVLKEKKNEITPLLLSSKTKRKKDPNAPKKWKTSYIFFCAEQREILRKQETKYKTTEITSKLAEMWKQLSDNERVKYEELSTQDKERYIKELSAYSPSEEYKKKETGPKRPTSSYMFFCKQQRDSIKKEFPNMNAKEITSELGKRWKNLSEQQKVPYIERQNKDKIRYQTEKQSVVQPEKEKKQKVRKTAPVKTTKRKEINPKKTIGFKNFCNEEKTRLESENPDWSSRRVTTELIEMWNELNEEDKQQYEDTIEEEHEIDLDD
jgi:hypothetical protein